MKLSKAVLNPRTIAAHKSTKNAIVITRGARKRGSEGEVHYSSAKEAAQHMVVRGIYFQPGQEKEHIIYVAVLS